MALPFDRFCALGFALWVLQALFCQSQTLSAGVVGLAGSIIKVNSTVIVYNTVLFERLERALPHLAKIALAPAGGAWL